MAERSSPESSADNIRLEVVRSSAGFLVTIGGVCLCLDRDGAEELLCRLAEALEPEDAPMVTLARQN